jgi:type II secretory pathway pseudopilin PulG
MNLREAFRSKKGITLIELLLACSLILIIGMFMFPIGMSFYYTQMRLSAHEGLENALRKAQQYSMTGKNGSAHGVRLEGAQYILYEGDSYAERTVEEDEVYHISGAVDIEGFTEINFASITGLPSSEATIMLEAGDGESYIRVESEGLIERE